MLSPCAPKTSAPSCVVASGRLAVLGGVFLALAGPVSAWGPAPVQGPDANQDLDRLPAGFSEYDVVWTRQSSDASESMPCGGRDTGLNVWFEDGELLLYLQRSGSLAENNEYLKLGRIRLQFEPNPFAAVEGAEFRQTLRLREGRVEALGSIRRGGLPNLEGEISVWVDTEDAVVHITVEGSEPLQVTAAYENWRTEAESIPNGNRRRSFFTLHEYPGEVVLGADAVAHREDRVVFLHRNPDERLATDLLIEQQGLQEFADGITRDLVGRTFGGALTGAGFEAHVESGGVYQALPYASWSLRSAHPARLQHLRAVTHIAQTEDLEDWRAQLDQRTATLGLDASASARSSRAWWAEFWSRSWIVIQPDADSEADRRPAWRAARNYNLFRYQLGCNALGEYPTKFNGGNFTYDARLVGGPGSGFGPDWRNWGGGAFTAQNQRLLYWPLLKSGDSDAIRPQIELYRKGLPGAEARVARHFGHAGAVYSEYATASGLALGAGYGWESGSRQRGPEIEFGDERATGAHGYRDPVEPGVMANPFISYHWCSQLEHAYLALEYRRFTGRSIASYMRFIEQAVIFFDEHYRLRQKLRTGEELGPDGRLVIYPSTATETYPGATNPTDAVSGLKACLEGLLALPEDELTLRDHAYYAAFEQALPELPFRETDGRPTIAPAASYQPSQNAEIPQFYPLFPFNRFDLIERDRDRAEAFLNTWSDGAFTKGVVASWHQDGIFLARMGLTDQAAAYNLAKLGDSPRRFPTFWGPGHDWVPDHNHGGSGMIGLQEMLMQTPGERILLLPAWPKDWDVDFRLHAPQQTTVTAKVRDGEVVELWVDPPRRAADVVICGQQSE